MKRKINAINIKQATMVAMAATMVMSSILASPKIAEAKYMSPSEYTNYYFTDNAGKVYKDQQDDIWFKAIYPDYNVNTSSIKDILRFYENDFKGPSIPDGNNNEKYSYLLDQEFITDPYHGYTKEGVMEEEYLNDYYLTLDPTKQYFPTLEFKVGSDIAYVDGKPFKLEAPVVKSKEGKVLVPMYHLSSILTTNPKALTLEVYKYENSGNIGGTISMMNPIGVS